MDLKPYFQIVTQLLKKDAVSEEDAVKRSELEDEVPLATQHRMEKLVDAGILDRYQPGDGKAFIVHFRTGEYLQGSELNGSLDEEVKRVRNHLATNSALKAEVSEEVDFPLSSLDVNETEKKMERLNKVVEAVDDSNHSRGDYGKIDFRNPAYRYFVAEEGALPA